ncbi:AAA family ATPase [uncultured Rubinisphaera sp.]|uniref:ExeA family protein n=1 Tax=uncultured Rubinisphaera sp. TaxID=1678686 RepID=UPI0030DD631F
MYETHFQLQDRPFSAAPDSRFVFYSKAFSHAIKSLELTARQGVGIGMLTGAAGIGKTLLCNTLAETLADDPLPVLLLNASFPTRSSLLQAILFELRRPYRKMTEQELRLELVAHGRDLCMYRTGVVLIVDEAHLLGEHVLEELRSLTNFIHRSRPIFRVILSGQPVLEDLLTRRSLEAINHKLEAHVCLDSLTKQESLEYLITRMKQCGGELLNIFEEAALETAIFAADGSPRCLNQLCDHACSLAFHSNSSVVTDQIVRSALSDLQKLPLHWNIPPLAETVSEGTHAESELHSETIEWGSEEEISQGNDVEMIEGPAEHLEEETFFDDEACSFEIGAAPVESQVEPAISMEIERQVEDNDFEDVETVETVAEVETTLESESELENSILEAVEEPELTMEETSMESESDDDFNSAFDEIDNELSLLELELSRELYEKIEEEPLSEETALIPEPEMADPSEESEHSADDRFAQIELNENLAGDSDGVATEEVSADELDEQVIEAEAILDRYAAMDARRLGQLDELESLLRAEQGSCEEEDLESRIGQSVLNMCTELSSELGYHDEDYVPHPGDVFGEPIDSKTARHDIVEPDYDME